MRHVLNRYLIAFEHLHETNYIPMSGPVNNGFFAFTTFSIFTSTSEINGRLACYYLPYRGFHTLMLKDII
ncbi:hypothetical protein [Mucilaginibacter sp.]|uniref:hypothetical protein n=1 Tax=Mucilaginibacter sp. TaxID=1882438 RepID=UPI0035BBE5D1